MSYQDDPGRFAGGCIWVRRSLESLRAIPPRLYEVRYCGNSVATFELVEDGRGGTDLSFIDARVSSEYRTEIIAGWVSVLMALKAAVDFGVDLRAHDDDRNWDSGYVDN